MKTLTTVCILCAMLICTTFIPAALAQTVEVTAKPLTDTDIQLLRSDLQSGKNEVIAHTMRFTEAESTAFWPLYRTYAHDQQVIGDARVQLIKDYAQNFDTMDDAKAKDMAQRLLGIDAKFTGLREDYWPKFEKALGAKRAAKFYQVDNRLSLMINLQLASEIPLIP
jgi:hypothetical protein